MFAASKTAIVSGAAPDDKFNYVTMLLHGDGTNGAQNNTFVDSSANGFSITRNGNTTQGSFSPYGDKWSNHFDGTGDYLSTPNVAALQPGTSTNPFCVECWVYPTSTPASDIAILGNYKVTSYPTNTDGFDILQTSSNRAALRWGYPNYADSGVSAVMTLNTWNHIAVCRNSSGSMSCYLNGTRWFNTSTNTSITNATASSFWVGWAGSLSGSTINPFNGYISNVRLVKGSAVYDPTSSTLTVPTSPLMAVTNTSLLTCQSNRFVDSSASPLTMTPSGNTSVQRFNPFGASTAYSTSVIGGSSFFPTSNTGSDTLSIASTSALSFTASDDLTVESWVYLTAQNDYSYICSKGNSTTREYGLTVRASTIEFYWSTNGGSSGDSSVTASFTFQVGTWYHVAMSKSGTSVRLFVNGTQQGSTGTFTTIYNGSSPFRVGTFMDFTGISHCLAGYLSNLRIVKGTAVYTSNFTPPTAPLTAITNTSLLLLTINGAIFDNAMMNDLETVGNAQISTSVKKYGTGSIAFDGSGDSLNTASNPAFGFGTGDFTVEYWVYPSLTGDSAQVIVDSRPSDSASPWLIGHTTGGAIRYYDGSTVRTGGTMSANTWSHVAWSRSSNVNRIFLNGTQVSTYTATQDFGSSRGLTIGSNVLVSNEKFIGNIDDLRITKGFARYTANFTAPTATFSDTGPY
jgi:hypothetical protein